MRSPPSWLASAVRKSVAGCLYVKRTVWASTFSTDAAVPSPLRSHPGIDGVRSLFRMTSLCQNTMSSAVNGAPSDQRAPLRSLIVQTLKSGDDCQLAAIFGSILAPSGEKRPSAS